MMIQVKKKKTETSDKLLKRYLDHVKRTKLLNKLRDSRYNTPAKGLQKVRKAAVLRTEHRKAAKKKQFLSFS